MFNTVLSYTQTLYIYTLVCLPFCRKGNTVKITVRPLLYIYRVIPREKRENIYLSEEPYRVVIIVSILNGALTIICTHML